MLPTARNISAKEHYTSEPHGSRAGGKYIRFRRALFPRIPHGMNITMGSNPLPYVLPLDCMLYTNDVFAQRRRCHAVWNDRGSSRHGESHQDARAFFPRIARAEALLAECHRPHWQASAHDIDMWREAARGWRAVRSGTAQHQRGRRRAREHPGPGRTPKAVNPHTSSFGVGSACQDSKSRSRIVHTLAGYGRQPRPRYVLCRHSAVASKSLAESAMGTPRKRMVNLAHRCSGACIRPTGRRPRMCCAYVVCMCVFSGFFQTPMIFLVSFRVGTGRLHVVATLCHLPHVWHVPWASSGCDGGRTVGCRFCEHNSVVSYFIERSLGVVL